MMLFLLIFLGLLFENAIACCYNSDCTNRAYTDTDDACFMAIEWPSQQNEGFCWGGNCIPFVGSQGTCQNKKSMGEGCLNAGGSTDNNICVTNLCSSSTSKCEARSSSEHCHIPPTLTPTSQPTPTPTYHPTRGPTKLPSIIPTLNPTNVPTKYPSRIPSQTPTQSPSATPSQPPTESPSIHPSQAPTCAPTNSPFIMTTSAQFNSKSTTADSSTLPIIGVVIAVLLLSVIIIGVWCWTNHKTPKTKRDEDSSYFPSKSQNRTDTELEPIYAKGQGATTARNIANDGETDERATNIKPHTDEGSKRNSNYNDALKTPIKVVDDALVIFFGICKYQHDTYSDLDDINEDEYFFRGTFETKFRYKFIKNDYNREWTKSEAEDWIESIRNNELTPHGRVQYNALIFCGASHGSMYSMICSDGKQLNVKDIRSLFAWNVNKKLRNLPKIFIFNCCRTKYQKVRGVEEESCAAGYSVSITGTEGDPVFGSKLSRYVATAFSECYDHERQKSVHDVLVKATRTAGTEGGMQLKLQEHDINIDDVVFLKKPPSRGSRAARVSRDSRQISLANELMTFLRKIQSGGELEKYYHDFQKRGYKTVESLVGIDDE
eukprot:193093_1